MNTIIINVLSWMFTIGIEMVVAATVINYRQYKQYRLKKKYVVKLDAFFIKPKL